MCRGGVGIRGALFTVQPTAGSFLAQGKFNLFF